MIDIQKHIEYWQEGADEDLEVAQELAQRGRTRHGLFLAHLALEKLLKAHVTRHIRNVPPKIHALLRLADLAGLALSDEQRRFLARFDRYQIEGRYPKMLGPAPTVAVATQEMREAEEMYLWLTQLL